MSDPLNIDLFNEYAGKIFAELYDAFPSPCALVPRKYIEGGIDAVYHQDGDFRKLTAAAEICANTIFWLHQEGYIAAKEVNRSHNGISAATLTEKGLAVLRFTPDALKEKSTLGERLATSAKSGAKEALKIAAKEALGVVVKIVSHS